MTKNTFVDLARCAHAVPLSIRACRTLLGSSALLAVVIAGGMPTAAYAGGALPSGGAVTSGTASISTGAGRVAVTQTSDRAIIDWQSFSVGAGNAVTFAQPGSGSATLNRVTGAAGSEIAGQIRANGAVYLVNPNGIAITASGAVKTGGGFIASTLDIKDADFNAGKLAFAGKGASASVRNSGSIAAAQGAYVALLGGSVANSGTISVPLGAVGLGSGEQIGLDVNGGHFMQVGVPTSAIAGNGSALIDMRGTIGAAGGRVVLSAATARSAIRNVINLSGAINADAAVGSAGSITLLGGEGGAVTASGTLSARATGASGRGGTVETSGAAVNFAGLKVDTSAAGGNTGTWLVDPTDLTVDAAAARTIKINLATSNVTLTTDGSAQPTGPGVTGPGSGDIFVNAPITWTSANTLTLSSYRNIAINAAITAPQGGLTLAANNSIYYQSGAVISATGAVKVGTFVLNSGNWVQNAATLPLFSATNFSINPQNGSFLRASGGDGSIATPYLLGDIYGLQGVRSYNLLDQNFALAADINAAGTAGWNGGAGFVSIGDNQPFTGSLDGMGHIVRGLTIAAASYNVGLFSVEKGTISNLRLVGGSVSTTQGTVGALVGFQSGGTITNVTSSTLVSGTAGNVGGLVGIADGAIVKAYVTGSVTSGGGNVGGLVGTLGYYQPTASISGSAARGNVTVTSGRGDSVGGLVGVSTGTIDGSFATGTVTAAGNVSDVGGLVGYLCSQQSGCSADNAPVATITRSYATGNVTAGGNGIGGLVGGVSNSVITSSYAKGKVTSVGSSYYTGGLVGDTRGTNTFTSVYAGGDVTGQASVGGLVGRAGGAATKIIASHASGNVLSGAQDPAGGGFGGLVGDLGQGSSVSRSYASGNVTNAFIVNAYGRGVGGLIGVAQGNVTYSHAVGAVSGTNDNVGGLIGFDIDNSGLIDKGNYATGNVTGNTLPDGYFNGASIGGLIGAIGTSKSITNSYATGHVSAISHSAVLAGGLVGQIAGGRINISKSYASGNVSVTGAADVTAGVGNRVGGLIGEISNGYGRIEQVYAAGDVYVDGGNSLIGGLVGRFYDGGNGGLIINAFATGMITARGPYGSSSSSQRVGGLIGDLQSGKVANSYANGTIDGLIDVGGLFGSRTSNGIVTSSYWNTSTVGQGLPGSLPGDNGQGGTGLTTEQMQDPANFATIFKGWDFARVWKAPMAGGYPLLRAFNP